MSKNSGWLPLDENLKNYLPTDRPYTKLEAMFSHQLDIKNEILFSVNGYAKLWQWSRNKVRFFLDNIKKDKGHPKGQVRDRLGTGKGQGVHLIILDLQKQKDTLGTGKGQVRDTPKDTTIKIDKRKSKIKTKEKDRISHFDSDLFVEKWAEFELHRRQKKSTLTDIARRNCLLMLSKFDVKTSISMIQQTLNNGWAGIFELKKETKNESTIATQEDFGSYSGEVNL